MQAMSISHFINSALVTAVLVPRRMSPASTTKPGKAPKNVDYVGNDSKQSSIKQVTDNVPLQRLPML